MEKPVNTRDVGRGTWDESNKGLKPFASDQFSLLEHKFDTLEKDIAFKKSNEKVAPFSAEESTKRAIDERLKLNSVDFWHFDRTYFTENMYSSGYSKECNFHKEIADLWKLPGVNVVLGPRAHGKTAVMKKVFAWLLLTGKTTFAATLSSTLPTSRNILGDIVELLKSERIAHDYKPIFDEENKDQATITIPSNIARKQFTVRIIALSEGRSARGATKLFDRPQFVLCDDLETRQSAIGGEHSTERIKILQETYQSMSPNGSLIVLGNNFDEKCALNRILIEKNEGLLPDYWRVFTYKAWNEEDKGLGDRVQGIENTPHTKPDTQYPKPVLYGPLWAERYPAENEEELKLMLRVSGLSEWLGDFQQEPAPEDGFIFQRITPIPTFSEIPNDAKGVIYCDPNMSKKNKGDTTAIIALLYSASTDLYYIENFVCRSFSDSDELLSTYLTMQTKYVRYAGFDGNVSQESTWTNNVRQWCKIHDRPYPAIFYKRYHVDELVKNVQSVWNSGKILMPENSINTEEGKRFLSQIFSFQGKKAGKKDDAPDGLVSVYQFLHEQHLGKKLTSKIVSTFADFFNF